jgi:hypothetical protein
LECARQNYTFSLNQQRKTGKNLEVTEKMPIFASSNLKFGYAAECGEQGLIDTAPLKVTYGWLLFFIFLPEKAAEPGGFDLPS